MPMTVKLSEVATNNVRYAVQYLDNQNNPVDIDGPQVCTSSNEAMATVASQDDSTLDKVVHFALSPVMGTVTVGGSGDADRGDGNRLLSWSDDITIVPDEAESVQPSAGELVPK